MPILHTIYAFFPFPVVFPHTAVSSLFFSGSFCSPWAFLLLLLLLLLLPGGKLSRDDGKRKKKEEEEGERRTRDRLDALSFHFALSNFFAYFLFSDICGKLSAWYSILGDAFMFFREIGAWYILCSFCVCSSRFLLHLLSLIRSSSSEEKFPFLRFLFWQSFTPKGTKRNGGGWRKSQMRFQIG